LSVSLLMHWHKVDNAADLFERQAMPQSLGQLGLLLFPVGQWSGNDFPSGYQGQESNFSLLCKC